MVYVKKLSRSYKIKPNFINQTLKIYDGKSFFNLIIVPDMVGYKIGEFWATKSKKSK